MVEFHRFEGSGNKNSRTDRVSCSFDTDRFGYVVVEVKRKEKSYHGELVHNWKFKTIENEPDLNMFTDSDVSKMEQIARIVWRMIYDTPAMKGRFETFK
jgi:hypothetical protein